MSPQLDDAVAEDGGVLEFQTLGRLPHLLLQLGDGSLPLLFGEGLLRVGQLALVAGQVDHVADGLDDRLGHDAVLPVEGVLLGPAALGLVDGPAHGVGDGVGVHDHQAVGVAGGPADGLDKGGLRPEEALLVGVQDGHQGHLRQIQALAEQVDAHQHVEGAQAQVADDLHALDGVDVVVHVAHLDAGVGQHVILL